jgi:hypothetical protein
VRKPNLPGGHKQHPRAPVKCDARGRARRTPPAGPRCCPKNRGRGRSQGTITCSFFLRCYSANTSILEMKSTRLCVLEDIAFSHGMAALIGLRLADLHGCRAVALLMVALSLAHVGYSAILRPWRARSDSLIAVGFATGNAVLGALVATFLFALPEGNVTGIGKAIGAVQLVLDVALYAEVVLAAALAIRQRFWVAANHDAVNPLPPDRDPAGTSEGLLERVPALSTEPRYSSSESPSFPSAPRNPLGR